MYRLYVFYRKGIKNQFCTPTGTVLCFFVLVGDSTLRFSRKGTCVLSKATIHHVAFGTFPGITKNSDVHYNQTSKKVNLALYIPTCYRVSTLHLGIVYVCK